MTSPPTNQSQKPYNAIQWKEVYALAMLSAAIAISWIAYHEYQPLILTKFNFTQYGTFLIIAKGIILVVVPPFAGRLSDSMTRKTSRPFFVFSYGIGATAMVFMIVASLINQNSLGSLHLLLPIMIVLWLIAMNVFTSPAISMIDSFAPTEKLPLVAAVLFFVVQLIFGLEPVIVQIITFFGETLTFIVGGLLIAGTGYHFQKVTKIGLVARTESERPEETTESTNWTKVIVIGFFLGFGTAFLVEFVPSKGNELLETSVISGNVLSFLLLAFSAVIALIIAPTVMRIGVNRILVGSLILLVLGSGFLWISESTFWFIFWGVFTAFAFALAGVASLPYVLNQSQKLAITLTVGIYLGATHIMEGILEYALQ